MKSTGNDTCSSTLEQTIKSKLDSNNFSEFMCFMLSSSCFSVISYIKIFFALFLNGVDFPSSPPQSRTVDSEFTYGDKKSSTKGNLCSNSVLKYSFLSLYPG